ncbi:MAG TPA: SurA N-terminal domain-containing protein [Stellaceae bacterium]|nr:SurA N-terminal domain-containing protein [Stellaceae bacterium]
MLQAIRTRAGGVIIKVLFGLLILSFASWGIYTRSPFSQDKGAPDAIVASVGDREVRADQFQAALKPTVERLRAQFGGSIDSAQIKLLGIPDAVLDKLIDDSLLDQEDTHLRLDLSDDVIRSAITSNPAFVGPDGRFNHDQFTQILAMYRMTEEGLVAKLRAEVPRGDLLQALTAGVRIPAPVIDTIYRYRSETRVADVVAIPLAAATGVGTPSDDDLQKFYETHSDIFKAEEYRSFTLASLGIADLASEINVSDDDLKAAYKERKDDLAIPEQRQIRQILATSEDKAKAVEDALAAGQDFTKVATTVAGQDPQTIDLGLVKASDLPKPLADAAFDLPLDKPSEPVKDSFGWHILLVTKIEPMKSLTFDEAKQQLKDELTQEAEADRLDHIAKQVDDALAGGASLADVAAKYHLTVTTVASTDAGGRDPDGKPASIPVSSKDVLKLVFESGENETSRVTAIEDGAIFVVHVDKVTPPRTKPIAEVKDQVVTAWATERKQDAVKKEADALAAAVAAGTPLAKAAADQKLTVTEPPPLTRRPKPGSAVPAPLVGKLFDAKVGDTVVASDSAGAYVGQLKEIKTSDTTPADLAKGLQSELTNAARYDLVGELTGALKKRYPVTIHRDVLDKMF